jgi:GTP-binding protein SAR1
LASCPILLLGNKIDKQGAAGEHEIRQIFRLFGKTTGQVNLVVKFLPFIF